MADNSTLPATGDVIAADEIGGVKYQRVKPVFGIDGQAVDVSAVNPLPTTDNLNPYRGITSYFSGVSGTVTIAAGARIVSLSARSPTSGTITIFGGTMIILPGSSAFSDGYSGFVGPGNIVFTGTDTYYVVVNQ